MQYLWLFHVEVVRTCSLKASFDFLIRKLQRKWKLCQECIVRWWVVQMLLDKNCVQIIFLPFSADVSYQTPDAGLWCGTPLSSWAAGNWKGKIRRALVKRRRGGGQECCGAHQGTLGHSTRKWTSLSWPGGSRSHSVMTWRREKQEHLCKKQQQHKIK